MSDRPAPTQQPRRTLVWTSGDLGHTLDRLPLFEAIARDGRQLVVVCSSDEARVLDPTLMRLRLDHTPRCLDAPLSLEPQSATAERLARLDPSDIVLLQATAGILVRLAGLEGPRILGVATRWRGALGRRIDVRIPPAEAPETRAFLDALGLDDAPIDDAPVDEPTLVVPSTWRAVGAERLQAAKIDLDEDAPLLGLSASRSGGRIARWSGWPRPRFTELARGLRRRDPRRRLVILAHGDAELWHAVRLHETTGRIHPVIGPDLHIDGIASVLSRLDLAVGYDSTLLDLAAAVGVPTVALAQSGGSRRTRPRAPRGPRHRLLARRHLASLDVDTVLDEVGGLLME